MKQYTTPEQTTKLIELGFDEPRLLYFGNNTIGHYAYTIGELIEMLLSKPYCRVSIYNIGLRQHKVLFKKLINGKFKVLFREVGLEPIDLLFNYIVKLKEEGVI